MESLADKYYTTIKGSRDPAFELTKAYCKALDIPVSASIKKMFNRLLALYGLERTLVGVIILIAKEERLPPSIERINFYLQGILSNELKKEYRNQNLGDSPSLEEFAKETLDLLEGKETQTFRFRSIDE